MASYSLVHLPPQLWRGTRGQEDKDIGCKGKRMYALTCVWLSVLTNTNTHIFTYTCALKVLDSPVAKSHPILSSETDRAAFCYTIAVLKVYFTFQLINYTASRPNQFAIYSLAVFLKGRIWTLNPHLSFKEANVCAIVLQRYFNLSRCYRYVQPTWHLSPRAAVKSNEKCQS